MPYRKRGFKIPYPGEKHSILWEIAGAIVVIAIIKALVESLLKP
jgi:hypothetical protein